MNGPIVFKLCTERIREEIILEVDLKGGTLKGGTFWRILFALPVLLF